MCQISKIAKHALIYVLIFTFFLGSFFVNPPKTKAIASLTSCNDTIPLYTGTTDRPIEVSLDGTAERVSETQIKVNLKINYKVVKPDAINSWAKSAGEIVKVRPQPQTWSLGTAEQTSKTIEVAKNGDAVFRAIAHICWQDTFGGLYRTNYETSNITLSNDPTGTKPPTIKTGTGPGTEIVDTPPTGGEDKCTKACPATGWFSISGAIQDAICKMQCTIIDWESSIIGWVIGKVLYPALGLCKDKDCDITPTAP